MNERLYNSVRVCTYVLILHCGRWEEFAERISRADLRYEDHDLKIAV